MDELAAGVRDLHQRVGHLDELLRADQVARDLHEKLGDAAAEKAEKAHHLLRKIMVIVAVGLLAWTPFMAYGAVWVHERVRNTCLPSVLIVDYIGGDRTPALDGDEPWYCGIFPGTGHPEEDVR